MAITNQIVTRVGSGLADFRQRNFNSDWPGALLVYVTNFDDMSYVGPVWASGFTIGSGSSSRLPPRPTLSGNWPGRKELWIYNNDNANPIFIGQSGITTDTGFPLATGQVIKLTLAGNADIFAIASVNGVQIKTLEIS